MKPKTLVLMGVAIACGLGASYMTARLLAERQTEDEPKIDVLVAKKTMNLGDTIKAPDEMFQFKRFTKGEEPPGAVTDFEALRNRVLKRPLRPGDHVTPDDVFGDKESSEVMSFMLATGYRAVGVRVNVESGASGFATLPLSRVDIISVVRRSSDSATYSQVLLENVLVLAADDKMRRDENGKPMPSQVVTLALKPEDMLKVRLAGEMGTLSLGLRKINDTSKVENGKLTYEQLKSGDRGTGEEVSEPKPIPVAQPKPPEPSTPMTDPPVVAKQYKKHTLAISEGGKTRYVDYYFNENGEVVEPEVSGQNSNEPAQPPVAQDAVDPNKK